MKVYCEAVDCDEEGAQKFGEDRTYKKLVLYVWNRGEKSHKHVLVESSPFAPKAGTHWNLSFHGWTWEYNGTVDRVFINNREIEL